MWIVNVEVIEIKQSKCATIKILVDLKKRIASETMRSKLEREARLLREEIKCEHKEETM